MYVSAYRKGYNSQHVLIRLLEERRQHLDNNDIVGGVFIDLSSAFDCLPHDLLIAKNWQHTLLMKICLCIYILIFQIESCASVLIMYTAVSKMFFLGYLKGPLSSLNCLIVSLMIFFYFADKASVHEFADDNSLSAFESNIKNLKVKQLFHGFSLTR